MRKVIIFILLISACSTLFRRGEEVNVIVPEESFKAAKELFNKGKYKDAIKKFKEVLYVKGYGDIADSAQLYIAESYLRMRSYDEAIMEYSSFLENTVGKSDTILARVYLGLAKAYNEKYKNLYLDISEIDKGMYYAKRVLDMGIFTDSARKVLAEMRYKKATKLLLEADVYYKLKILKSWKLYLSEFLKLYPDDPRADSIKRLLEDHE